MTAKKSSINPYSAPAKDIDQRKIKPCRNHTAELGCRTFFQIFSPLKDLEPEEISTEVKDIFRFDISKCDRQFIPFKCVFNCWTTCQKPQFSDKKSNMIFRTTIEGDEKPPIIIDTTLNVQQNPGRGSKTVTPGIRVAGPQGMDSPKNATKLIMHIKLDLDPKMEKSRLFDQNRYIKQLTADLTYHAQLLHHRDKKHYERLPQSMHMTKGQRMIAEHTLQQASINNNAARPSGSVINATNAANTRTVPIQPATRPVVTLTIELPRDYYNVLGQIRGQIELDNLRAEMETVAVNRTNDILKRALYEQEGNEAEKSRLRNMVAITNGQLEMVTNENNQLKIQLNEMYSYFHQQTRPAGNLNL